MSNFWPTGIEISDTQSPREILNTAQEEWKTNSNGLLQLVLQDTQSQSGHSMIIVHAKHTVSNRTAALFSIVHQNGKPYPVRIQPEKEELPTFLKKSYDVPKSQLGLKVESVFLGKGLGGLEPAFTQWVSDTPSEFRKKLSEVFNLGIIKREILNLVSNTSENVNNTNQDLTED
jgi:hypothetical protein